jgi:hypothetical protein
MNSSLAVGSAVVAERSPDLKPLDAVHMKNTEHERKVDTRNEMLE